MASSEGGDARHSGVLRGCPARDPILVELLATAAPLPGAEAFTRLLAARRVPMAIATSTEAALFAIKAAPHRPW